MQNLLVCVCETWSLEVREELVMEYLRTFGAKREEETEEWKQLYNQDLHNFYTLQIIRVIN
jgi:hypothetical protein